MTKPYRVSAGGVVLHEHRLLLVRYPKHGGGTLLAGPGGALEQGENAVAAIIREAKEETGILVQPKRVLFIEDLTNQRYKMCKIWMLCEYVDGEIVQTPEAELEGIIECGWFTRQALEQETVFPPELLQHDWDAFQDDAWSTVVLPSRVAIF